MACLISIAHYDTPSLPPRNQQTTHPWFVFNSLQNTVQTVVLCNGLIGLYSIMDDSTNKTTESLGNLSLDNKVSDLLAKSDTLQELLTALASEIKSNPDKTFDQLILTSAKDLHFVSLYKKVQSDASSSTKTPSKATNNGGLLATLVASDKHVHDSFAAYISSFDPKQKLANFYSSLQTTSDPRLAALFSVYGLLPVTTQRFLLEIVSDGLKKINSRKQLEGANKDTEPNKRTRESFFDLQVVSRYFIHSAAAIHGSRSGLPANSTTPDSSSQEVKFVQSQRQKILSLISPYADRRLPQRWVSPVVMTIVKLLEIDHEGTVADLQTLTEDLLLLGTDGSSVGSKKSSIDMYFIVLAFSIIALLFHIDKEVGFRIFMSNPVMNQYKLFTTNSDPESGEPSLLSSEQSVVAALDMLSAACLHKEARALIKTQFLGIVKYALDLSDKPSVRVLAASILVKTSYSGDKVLEAAQKKQNNDAKEKQEKEEDDIDLKEMSIIFETEVAKHVEPVKDSKDIAKDEFDFELDDSESDSMSRSVYEIALEGLSFTSLKPDTKMRVVSNQTILDNLVAVITDHTREIPWVYCALSVFSNVTMYAPKITAEQEKLTKLKAYAEGGQKKDVEEKTDPKKDFEPDNLVALRNKKIIDKTKLVQALTNCAPHFTQTCCNTAAAILRNLATEKTSRGKFAQQGGISVLLYLILPLDPEREKKSQKESGKDAEDAALIMNWDNYRVDPQGLIVATSGLARTLISIDPSHALGSKISPTIAILPLLRQLSNVMEVGGSSGAGLGGPLGQPTRGSAAVSDIPLLDIFESLLALTNLAAVDNTCSDIIVRLGWSRIENLMLSNNILVQRASIELVCNLATSMKCAEMFCNTDNNFKVLSTSASRLELLAALTDLDDAAARTAAIGAIATLTGWGRVVDMAMRQCTKLVNRLVEIVHEEVEQLQEDSGSENVDVLIRALSALEALIGESLEELMGDNDSAKEASPAMQSAFERSKKESKEFILVMNKQLRPLLPSLITRSRVADVKELAGDLFRTLASYPI